MRKQALVFLTLTLVTASLHGQTADFAAFDTRLQELMKEHKLPGLAASIVKDHRLAWAKGYGFADQDRETAGTPDTPFWIASVTGSRATSSTSLDTRCARLKAGRTRWRSWSRPLRLRRPF